ncbi:MAG: hypothetical protein ACRETA_01520 [Gammaproteobacteria bacterium]
MLRALLKHSKRHRQHDIPYLAGHSRDGKTIYIDRELSRYLTSKRKRIQTDRDLILHETVENHD